MSHADFVHLRNHSAYSLSQGAIRIPELVSLAAKNGMPAVALTDSGNLFGALEFSLYCRSNGVQPIVGCQISLPPRSTKPGAMSEPLVVLARNEEGLANLQILSSEGFLNGDPADPSVAVDFLCQHAAGLFLLTGGNRGPINKLILEEQKSEAQALLTRLEEAFRGNIAVELNRLGEAGEREVESILVPMAEKKEEKKIKPKKEIA